MKEDKSIQLTALINLENCNKCGLCIEVAPSIIAVDNDNYPYWLYGYSQGDIRLWQNFSAEFIDNINEAIGQCTSECITLIDSI